MTLPKWARTHAGAALAGGAAGFLVVVGWIVVVVVISPPQDTTFYDFMKDQGGWIGGCVAGLFTLGGGALAYLAGYMQAQRTMEAATLQIAVAREQMAQELSVITDRDRREARALLAGLATEAARLKMILSEASNSLGRRTGGDYTGSVPSNVADTYLAEPDHAVRAALIGDTQLSDAVVTAARVLFAELDKLNALIRVRAKFGDLGRADLRDAFVRASEAATKLEIKTALVPHFIEAE